FSATPTAVASGPARPGAHVAEVARDWAAPEVEAAALPTEGAQSTP
ncbi:CoA transferase, partial [Streptomyces cacaoi]